MFLKNVLLLPSQVLDCWRTRLLKWVWLVHGAGLHQHLQESWGDMSRGGREEDTEEPRSYREDVWDLQDLQLLLEQLEPLSWTLSLR